MSTGRIIASHATSQISTFFEKLVLDYARPYALRAPYAQQATRQLLASVGNPHHGLCVVHIAGSKGKGATALLTEAILQAAGWRTGTFTSPHLQRWNERFRLNGREIDDQRLAATLDVIRPHISQLQRTQPESPPSFFAAATAAALLLFRDEAVDCAIVETGIGGRLDATNVVDPTVTCITSIELEHTDKLGDTLAAIAREKAGIIKRGAPLVVGRLPDAAMQPILAKAAAVAAPVSRIGREVTVTTEACPLGGLNLSIETEGVQLQANLPVLGRHLGDNAGLALACVQQLHRLSSPDLVRACQRGFSSAALPGRTEILRRSPWVIADGAHTEASARALLDALQSIPVQHREVVLSVTGQKDLARLWSPLLSESRAVTVTQADPQRSLPAETLAAWVRQHHPRLPIEVDSNPRQAVRRRYARLPAHALLCITGSMYLAGIARTAFGEPKFAASNPNETNSEM